MLTLYKWAESITLTDRFSRVSQSDHLGFDFSHQVAQKPLSRWGKFSPTVLCHKSKTTLIIGSRVCESIVYQIYKFI
ncbi:hypothetical protein SAMD00079811_83210 (plasmid) [Scytonema sp. HK-05]|nr:hypothetical protein SAMD00079811_83210 [Scytonema sp. HK-05]